MAFGLAFGKRNSLEVSAGLATWSAAGPWHASQPCFAAPPRVSFEVAQCLDLAQLSYSLAWQSLQASAPAYPAAVRAEVAAFC